MPHTTKEERDSARGALGACDCFQCRLMMDFDELSRASSGSTGAPPLMPSGAMAFWEKYDECAKAGELPRICALNAAEALVAQYALEGRAPLDQQEAGSTGGAPSWEVAGAAPATEEPTTSHEHCWVAGPAPTTVRQRQASACSICGLTRSEEV